MAQVGRLDILMARQAEIEEQVRRLQEGITAEKVERSEASDAGAIKAIDRVVTVTSDPWNGECKGWGLTSTRV